MPFPRSVEPCCRYLIMCMAVLIAVATGCRRSNSPDGASNTPAPAAPIVARKPNTTGSKQMPVMEKHENVAAADAGRKETLESVGYSTEQQMTAAMATVRVINPHDVTEGSGVIIARRDRTLYVLTAAHIVNGARSVDIHLFSTATYPKPACRLRDVQVLADSPQRDLALLRAEEVPIETPCLQICPQAQMPKQSEFWVMTVGCGNGKPPAPLLDRVVRSLQIRRPDTKRPVHVWELQQRQSPGRSGGPMVDLHLRVLGIGTGASGAHGYYSHLSEIHAFLEDSNFKQLK